MEKREVPSVAKRILNKRKQAEYDEQNEEDELEDEVEEKEEN